MRYTVYTLATGAIVKSGECAGEAACLAQAADGQGVLLGVCGQDDRQRVEDGALVDAAPILTRSDLLRGLADERARRLAAGFEYNFGSDRGLHRIGTTESDMRGWDEVTQLASALNAVGQGSAPIAILTDTGPVTITAQEWPEVLIAAGAFRQPIWAASFALAAMAEIPADYTADHYWT